MATPTQDRDSDSEDLRRRREVFGPRRFFPPSSSDDFPTFATEETREPTETLELNEDYFEALKLGEVLVTYARLMMIGPGGGGKTSLKHGLTNTPLPVLPTSTPLANATTVKCHQWASAGAQAGQYWTEMDEDSEIGELAALLHVVLNLKANPHAGISVAALLASEEEASAIEKFQPQFVTDENTTEPTHSNHQPRSTTASDSESERIVARIMHKVDQRLQDWSRERNHEQNEVLIHMWDSGGQRVFLDILPAFLTSRTVFMLVFNAAVDIHRKLRIATLKNGRIVHEEDYHLTTAELLLQWMAAIHAHLSLRNPDNTPATPYPRILCVGTHKDQLPFNMTEQGVFNSLQSQMKGKAYVDLLMPSPWFLVNNNTAGDKENEDPAFKELRDQVFKFATENFTVPTPVSWVLFRKVLQSTCKENNKPVLSYKETLAVAKACSITAKALPSVLNFYHELGVFLYYSNIRGLQDWVIADPQWLVAELAKLLSPQGLHDVSQQYCWELLRTRGILVQHLYGAVWKGSPVAPEALVSLLEHFLLAARVTTTDVHHYTGKEYFVPCMLNGPSDQKSLFESFWQKIRTLVYPKKARPVHLVFDTQYVPPGFFVRVLTAFLNDSNCQILFKKQLDRYTVTIAYEEVDEVTLKEYSESIVVEVVRVTRGGSRVLPFPTACRNILEQLNTSIAAVGKWFPSVKVNTAFKCERCRTPLHFAIFNQSTLTDSRLRCQNDEVYQSSPQQQYWLKPVGEPAHQQSAESSQVSVELTTPRATSQRDHGTMRKAPQQKPNEVQASSKVESVDSLVVCARYIKGNITSLASALGIHGTELRTTQSRYKPQGQALQLLQLWWWGPQGGDKHKLAGILRSVGFEKAAEELLSAEDSKRSLQQFSNHTEVNAASEIYLSMDDIRLLMEILGGAAPKWKSLGIFLGISVDDLGFIENKPLCIVEGPKAFLRELLIKWLKQAPPIHSYPTVAAMVDALRKIEEESLANKLPQKIAQTISADVADSRWNQ